MGKLFGSCGGRLSKVKGQVVSYAPSLVGQLMVGVSALAFSAGSAGADVTTSTPGPFTIVAGDDLLITIDGSIFIDDEDAAPGAYVAVESLDDPFENSIENLGTVSVEIESTSASTLAGAGIYIGDIDSMTTIDLESATIDNTGTIAVDVVIDGYEFSSSSSASISVNAAGAGVVVGSLYDSVVSNTGDLEVSVIGEVRALVSSGSGSEFASADVRVTATGISAGDLNSGSSVTNTGQIDVESNAYASAEVRGSSASTSATISANAGVSGEAYGIAVGNVDASDVDNSGVISVEAILEVDARVSGSSLGSHTANADINSYSGYGIQTGDLSNSSSVTNSGTVSVTLDGDATAFGSSASRIDANASIVDIELYGIEVGLVQGASTVSNSGAIEVAADLYAEAVASPSYTSASANVDVTLDTVIGIQASGVNEASEVSNSGSISITAELDANAQASGTSSINANASAFMNQEILGIGIDGNVEGESLISNSGAIDINLSGSANAVIFTGSSVDVYARFSQGSSVVGVKIDGDVADSAISNSGTITIVMDAEVVATGAGDGNADVTAEAEMYSLSGIYANELTDSSITNSGTIALSQEMSATATATATSTSANASASIDFETLEGIEVDDLIRSSVENSGTISFDVVGTANANASAPSTASASAVIDKDLTIYGIETGNLSDGSSVTNSGSIIASVDLDATAQATADDASAEASASMSYFTGIDVGSLSDSDVVNSGTIRFDYNADVLADANGTDTADADANAAFSDVYGIDSSTLNNGSTLVNSGSILLNKTINSVALADATSEANATASVDGSYNYGIAAGSVNDSAVVNSGTISIVNEYSGEATANADSADASVDLTDYSFLGIDTSSVTSSTVENSGTILLSSSLSGVATANGSSTADATAELDLETFYGIDVSSIFDGSSVINSGSIVMVGSIAATANANAGSNSNDEASADATASDVSFNGIDFGNVTDSEVINSGSIEIMFDLSADATAIGYSADASASAAVDAIDGIDGSNVNNSTVANSGEIIVVGTLDANAIANGTGSADADATLEFSSMVGIDASSVSNGSIVENSGTIDMRIDATGNASARAGSSVSDDASASLSISDLSFVGIDTGSVTDSTVSNSGTINFAANVTGSAVATGYSAEATISLSDDDFKGIDVSTLTNSTVENTGDISIALAYDLSVQADGVADASADISYEEDIDAAGIGAGSLTDSTVSNSGTLAFSVDGTFAANATTTIVGTAGDSAFASVSVTDHSFYGIDVSSVTGSTVENSGLIDIAINFEGDAVANGPDASADGELTIDTAVGIDASTLTDSTVENTGTIRIFGELNMNAVANGWTSADASASFDFESLVGIDTSNVNDSTVSNEGVININVVGSAEAFASTSLSTGTQDASAVASGYADLKGFDLSSLTGSTASNTGSIVLAADLTVNASANGAGSASADSASVSADLIGMEIAGVSDSEIENSGVISLTLDQSATAQATGATSSVQASATAAFEVKGIDTGLVDGSSLDNSGTIAIDLDTSVIANALAEFGTADASAFAYISSEFVAGIETDGFNNSELSNSGVIDVNVSLSAAANASGANGLSSSANITNIFVAGINIDGDVTGTTVENTGVIRTVLETNLEGGSTNSSDNVAIALNVDGTVDSGSVLSNSGQIIAQAPDEENAYAILIDELDGTLELDTAGFIVGRIVVGDAGGDGTVMINSSPDNAILYTIENGDASAPIFVIDDSSGMPIFTRVIDPGVEYANGATQFATYDTSILAAGANALGERAGLGKTRMLTELSRATAENQYWSSFTGSSTSYESGESQSVDIAQMALQAGVAKQLSNGINLGAMLTVANGSVTSQSSGSGIDSSENSFMASVMGQYNVGSVAFHAGLTAGRTSYDTSRLVNDNLAISDMGIGTASSEYSGTWFSPEVGVSSDFAINSDWTMTPSLTYRYATESVDGVSEGSGDDAVTVASRTVNVSDVIADVAFSRGFDDISGYDGIMTGRVGLLNRKSSGDSEVAVSMFDTTLDVPIAYNDVMTGYVSFGVEANYNENTTIGLNLSHSFSGEGTDGGNALGLEVGFKF